MFQLGFHQVGIYATCLVMLGFRAFTLDPPIISNHLINFVVLLCSANHVVSFVGKDDISGNLVVMIDA